MKWIARLFVPLALLVCLAAQVPWLVSHWYNPPANRLEILYMGWVSNNVHLRVSYGDDEIKLAASNVPPRLPLDIKDRLMSRLEYSDGATIRDQSWESPSGMITYVDDWWMTDSPRGIVIGRPGETQLRSRTFGFRYSFIAWCVPLLASLALLLPPVRRAVLWWGRLLLDLARVLTGCDRPVRRGFEVVPGDGS